MIHIYFVKKPDTDRWFFGDRYLRAIVRQIVRGKKPPGGVEKVFINLCKSFDKLNVEYLVNQPFNKVKPEDKIIILGTGKHVLDNYNLPNKIVAGVGLMTHPSEWPDLCEKYPVKAYLQHSNWANEVYKPYYGDKCMIWPVGIDTDKWQTDNSEEKTLQVLIYNKIKWDKEKFNETLLNPIKKILENYHLSYEEWNYGAYQPEDYKKKLNAVKCMIFLSEHESQGIALQEAMSMDIPIFAWEQGFYLDPNRFIWNDPIVRANSVPYFDQNCGDKFVDKLEFEQKFAPFWQNVIQNKYSPRKYVLENLSLEKSGNRMLEILKLVYK
jgi:hypothetical protein